MTLDILQFIRDNNTLTRTSAPHHTTRRKDMKYLTIASKLSWFFTIDIYIFT